MFLVRRDLAGRGSSPSTLSPDWGQAGDPPDTCRRVCPPGGYTWRPSRRGLDRRGWGRHSPAGGLGQAPGPRDTCRWVLPPAEHTWSLAHRGWGGRGSWGWVGRSAVGDLSPRPDRCWHTRRSSRGPSWDSRGPGPRPTNRWRTVPCTGRLSGDWPGDRRWRGALCRQTVNPHKDILSRFYPFLNFLKFPDF